MNRLLLFFAAVLVAYVAAQSGPPTDNEQDASLKRWREELNVAVFTGQDYPAIFAIFAGLIIVLVLALIYIIVGMMSMDPSKDSIIYRMATTRMKKD